MSRSSKVLQGLPPSCGSQVSRLALEDLLRPMKMEMKAMAAEAMAVVTLSMSRNVCTAICVRPWFSSTQRVRCRR